MVGCGHPTGTKTAGPPGVAGGEKGNSKAAAEEQRREREERIARLCDRLTGDLGSAVVALEELIQSRSTSPRAR